MIKELKILDLGVSASREEVKVAYREALKIWHPDRFVNDESLQKKAEEKTREINAAYSFIDSNWENWERSGRSLSDWHPRHNDTLEELFVPEKKTITRSVGSFFLRGIFSIVSVVVTKVLALVCTIGVALLIYIYVTGGKLPEPGTLTPDDIPGGTSEVELTSTPNLDNWSKYRVIAPDKEEAEKISEDVERHNKFSGMFPG